MKISPNPFLLAALLAGSCLSGPIASADQSKRAAPVPNVTFTVTGPDGKPVAGAAIAIYTPFGDDRQTPPLQTDAAGQCNASAPPSEPSPFYAHRYIIYRPGFALAGGLLSPGQLTVQLKPGHSTTGLVVDGNGQPVPGAQVRLSGIYADNSWIGLTATPLADRFTARGDASGHWVLDDLPAGASADVDLDDPRFAHVAGDSRVGESAEQPLVARPDAQIAGRCVFPDGKPASGLTVSVAGQDSASFGYGWAVTDADGRFLVAGLVAGNYKVECTADQELSDWVAPTSRVVWAQAGRATELPDIVLSHGGVVQGRVTNAKDGSPVAGALVGCSGPDDPGSGAMVCHATTDVGGNYHMRVAPGANHFFLIGTPPGYQHREASGSLIDNLQEVNVAANANVNLSFSIEPSPSISGDVVDTDGQPALGASILLGHDSNGQVRTGKAVPVDATGHWRAADLPPGDLIVAVNGPWVLISPETVHSPLNKPLRIVVAPLATAGVPGVVKTPTGQPIAGAQIHVYAFTESRIPIALNSSAISDSLGHYMVQGVRPHGQLAVKAFKPDYKFVSGGVTSRQDDRWSITPAVLKPFDSQVRGTVRDATGTPLAGVRIYCPQGDTSARATSAADGSFTLSGLLPEPVDLVAVSDNLLALAHLNASTRQVILTAAPPMPGAPVGSADALALLQDTAEQLAGYPDRVDFLAQEMARYDVRHAIVLSQQMDGSVPDEQLRAILQSAAASPNPDVAQCEAALARIQDHGEWIQAAASVGSAIARADRPAGEALFNRLLSLLPRHPGNLDDVLAYAGAAHLATVLGDADAVRGFEVGLAGLQAARAVDAPGSGNVALYVGIADAGQPTQIEQTAAQFPAGTRREIIATCLPAIAKTDLTTARRLFESLAHMPAPGIDKTWANDEVFDAGATSTIAVLGATDPAAALALARQVASPRFRRLALALAAACAQPQAATALFREAFTMPGDNGRDGDLPRIAALAWRSQPALGLEFFSALRPRIDLITDYPSYSQLSFLASFAYDEAHIDPLGARILVEERLARSLQYLVDVGHLTDVCGPLMAMAVLDPHRAIELVQKLPITQDPDTAIQASDAAAALARYIMTPPEQRDDLRPGHHGFESGDYSSVPENSWGF